MVDENIFEYSFKRKDQAITMDSKQNVKIDEDHVKVDPQLLFQRLISAAQQTITQDEIGALFTYELCTFPPSLFDVNGLMRVPNKPQLKDAMAKITGLAKCTVDENGKYVLDGGALLQKLPWTRGVTFDAITEIYSGYILKCYGSNVVVVFDGYPNTPTTKDCTHQRRNTGKASTDVKFDGNTTLNIKKEIFLANLHNKSKFICMLRAHLQSKFIETIQSEDDADLLIVTTAVKYAADTAVTVIGDDTDLLVLLCYHVNNSCKHVVLKQTQYQNTKKKYIWHIQDTQTNLGSETCSNLLFLHAILGCDTTSRIFSLGKSLSLKKFRMDNEFRECSKTFHREEASHEEIIEAGQKALVVLFNGKQGDTLNSLRMSRFYQKVAESVKCVTPEQLPPTQDTAKYHSYRVYFQIQVWRGNNLDAQAWGWKIVNGRMLPIQTDRQPAPDKLLKVIRCKCKTECRTARCTCKKHGLECSPMCSDCRGLSCFNSFTIENVIDDYE